MRDPFILLLALLVLAMGFYRIYVLLYLRYDLIHQDVLYDFKICLEAARQAQIGGVVYNMEIIHPYKYAPLYLIFLFPLASLTLPVAGTIFLAVTVLATAGMVWLGGLLARHNRWVGLWALVVFLALYHFWRHSLILGQIQSLWMFGLLAAVYSHLHQRNRTAGLLWAVSSYIKPLPLIFIFYFAARRAWKVLAYFAVGLGLCLLTQVIFLGWSENWRLMTEWLHLLNVQSHHFGELESLKFDNLSIQRQIIGWLGPGPHSYDGEYLKLAYLPMTVVKGLAMAVIGLMVALSTAVVCPDKGEEIDDRTIQIGIALFLILPMLISPLVWMHYYYLLWWPIAVALAEGGRAWRDRHYGALVWLSLFVLLFFVLERVFNHSRHLRNYWFYGGQCWALVSLWIYLLLRHPRCTKDHFQGLWEKGKSWWTGEGDMGR